MNNSIKPGAAWYDLKGKLIQTHGGSVLYPQGICTGMEKMGYTGL